MAYIKNPGEEYQPTGGGGALLGGITPPQAIGPQGAKPTTTGFQNIRAYLDANQPQVQQMTDTVAAGLKADTSAANNAVTSPQVVETYENDPSKQAAVDKYNMDKNLVSTPGGLGQLIGQNYTQPSTMGTSLLDSYLLNQNPSELNAALQPKTHAPIITNPKGSDAGMTFDPGTGGYIPKRKTT